MPTPGYTHGYPEGYYEISSGGAAGMDNVLRASAIARPIEARAAITVPPQDISYRQESRRCPPLDYVPDRITTPHL